MAEQITKEVREYMSRIASKRTPQRSAASRQNAAKAAEARRKNPLDLPCICEGGESLEPTAHKTTCPRGRLLRQRARSAAQQAARGPRRRLLGVHAGQVGTVEEFQREKREEADREVEAEARR